MIEIRNLNKTYHLKTGDVTAVRDVSLDIRDGEIFGVIGYSGAGKSTLVRLINLLEIPDSGDLTVGQFGRIHFEEGKLTDERGARVTEKQLCGMRRKIGMIFQHFNLLDRSTVFENVAYPLRYTGMSRQEIDKRVRELLALVDLTDKIGVYPSQLSGGQKQRVAIARALASNPDVLLSDEATSALDPEATEAILHLLRKLNKQLGLTIVLITHEMAVIKSTCHRVAVMENGCVVEQGSVYDVFSNPQQPITQRFVDSASVLRRVYKLVKNGSPLVETRGNARLIKMIFGRDSVGEAMLSTISQKFNVKLNLVLANVEILQEAPLGGIVAILEGEEENIVAALRYLEECRVSVEVIVDGRAH